MVLRQANGRSGSVGIFPLIVSLAPVRHVSGSGVLKIGCLNVRERNEVEKRGKEVK